MVCISINSSEHEGCQEVFSLFVRYLLHAVEAHISNVGTEFEHYLRLARGFLATARAMPLETDADMRGASSMTVMHKFHICSGCLDVMGNVPLPQNGSKRKRFF